jgi:hypothetical protein
MREIRRQGQGAVVVSGPFRSVERSGRDVVRELLDGSRNLAPGLLRRRDRRRWRVHPRGCRLPRVLCRRSA